MAGVAGGCSGARTSTATRNESRSRASTSSRATTGSRSTTWCPTTTSTTRRTAKSNRDGSNDNLSWNCGSEGPSDDAAIEALRNRQVKNFLMLDAARRPACRCCSWVTRSGGRSAATTTRTATTATSPGSTGRCWSGTRDVRRFVKTLNDFRQRRDVVVEERLDDAQRTAAPRPHRLARRRAQSPDWSEHSHTLAFTWRTLHARFLLHGMLNAYWEPLTFELPPVPDDSPAAVAAVHRYGPYASPHDVYRWEEAPTVAASRLPRRNRARSSCSRSRCRRLREP